MFLYMGLFDDDDDDDDGYLANRERIDDPHASARAQHAYDDAKVYNTSFMCYCARD